LKELVLDAEGWNTRDDFYEAFFKAVGAPSWHGRNLNALNDSIATGRINKVEVPYCIVIRNYDLIGTGALQIVHDVVELVSYISSRGCPVRIRTENSN
jgi:RNAse (barnase) inhibitor barstar